LWYVSKADHTHRIPRTIGGVAANANDVLSWDGLKWKPNAGALTLESLTINGLTPSTLIYSNASKQITSLANSGAVSFLRNDGAGALSWVTTVPPSAHNVLDSTYHGDVLTGSITRGDVLYGNATPKIARLALGGITGSVLTRDATDVLWSAGALSFGGAYTLTISGNSSINGTAIVGTPGTLTVATTNSATDPHTHALTSSSNPGAAASLLASDASGYLRLVAAGINHAATAGSQLDIQQSASGATLGSELITNGGFDTGDFTGWTAGANWSVVSNAAYHTPGSTAALSQNISVTNGAYYYITITKTGTGTFTVTLGSDTVTWWAFGSGVTNVYGVRYSGSTGTAAFTITPASAFDGTVDSISVKRVTTAMTPMAIQRAASGAAIGDVRLYDNSIGYGVNTLTYGQAVSHASTFAFGHSTMENVLMSDRVVALGVNVMRRLAGARWSVGIGYSAFGVGLGGSILNCVAIGDSSAYNSNNASYNTSIGAFSLYTNVAGSYITAIGYQAALNQTSATTANQFVTAVGAACLYNSTSGTFNTAIGVNAGYGITTGSQNTVAGYDSGNTTNKSYTALYGMYSGRSVGNSSVCVGYHAGSYETGSSVLFIDAVDRTNEAGGRIKALIYGGFASAPASQQLTVNGVLQAQIQSALTNTVQNLAILDHQTTGTPAAGFGGSLIFQLQSSTTVEQSAAILSAEWLVATHASRTARIKINPYDTAVRDGIWIDSDGSRALIGIGGTTPTARLHLPAGGTAANTAPLKFTTQVSALTNVEQGTMELVGNSLQFTQLAKRRGIVMSRDTRTSDFQLVSSASESAAIITIEHGAGYLEVGKTERIELWGTVQKDVGTPTNTLTIRVKYAGVTIHTIVSSNAAIAANTDIQVVVITTLRSTGATGTLQINSIVRIAGDVITPAAPTLATVNTTSAQNTTITAQFTNSSATNNLVIHQGYVLCVEPNK